MTEDGWEHRPVLLEPVLHFLRVQPAGRYVDGTYGRGGHSRVILGRLGPQGRMLVIDKDPQAAAVALEELGNDLRVTVRQGSFAALGELVDAWGQRGRVSGILFDLGVSSPQLDDPRRGFSFTRDGPLDMRMDPSTGLSAGEWLAGASMDEIASVLKEYGEERFARRIARAIVRIRGATPIRGTAQLADIIRHAVPHHEPGKHPATRSFQAIRIFINQELRDLELGLARAVEVLAPLGRLVVISFHSLEHRIVKRCFAREVRGGEFPARLPVTADRFHPRLRLVCRGLAPDEAELAANPRARSAVLRAAERLP